MRDSTRARARKMRRRYLSTIGFCGIKIFYFNLNNSGIYATPELVATADYRSLPRFSCFHTHAKQRAGRITHMRARVYRDGQIGGRQKAERELYT